MARKPVGDWDDQGDECGVREGWRDGTPDEYESEDVDFPEDPDDDDSDTSICPHCGHEIYADADYCPSCRHAVISSPAPARRRKFVVTMSLLLLLIFAIAYGVFR